MSRKPVRKVSEVEIRRVFNSGRYLAMIANKTLVGEYLRDKVLDPATCTARNEPSGTRGQTILYRDRYGQVITVVFQYLRPDGSIGASGLPDPKKIWLPNEILELDLGLK